MLDQLVESKSNAGENTRRSGFFLTTFVIMVSIMGGGLLYSLFAKDIGLGAGDLELSELVAPVPVAEEEPPPPEPEQPKQEQKAAPNADVRKEVLQSIEESPQIPDKISVEKQTIPARRPNVLTVRGDTNLDARDAVDSNYRGPVSTDNTGVKGPGGVPGGSETGGTKPPPPPPPPAPPKPVVPKKISGGVLNGKATSLPKPPYPAAARAVRASGAVNVQVTISESGSVVSASAVSGHPLLRQAAEQAARSAKFAPTLLSGQAVSVTGVIVYNFVP
ncbi:MAG: energy transducer TonB [Acidobacteriota bacterium]|jgi:protein TonB|nr:energy transducer TonB [Acidobacteriota bacterium]